MSRDFDAFLDCQAGYRIAPFVKSRVRYLSPLKCIVPSCC
uniref:Uncharacterized protein n=1 Tax=Arundo donax TaxID=35708 RepID=A0A0A9A6D2_ARUDO